MTEEFAYKGYVRRLAEEFGAALQKIEAVYNYEFGNEFEVAICKTLRQALPQKFGIARGFIVTESGETAGDDIIIYDRYRFPTLRVLGEDCFRDCRKISWSN